MIIGKEMSGKKHSCPACVPMLIARKKILACHCELVYLERKGDEGQRRYVTRIELYSGYAMRNTSLAEANSECCKEEKQGQEANTDKERWRKTQNKG